MCLRIQRNFRLIAIERVKMVEKNISLPWWQKYTLTIDEASQYFGIGEKTLRKFIKEHENENFIIYNGTKIHIKRKVFEKYIDENVNIL